MRIHSDPMGAKTVHTDPTAPASGGRTIVVTVTLLACSVIAALTLLRTNLIQGVWPARANLHRAVLVTKPEGWQPREDAARAFFATWCKWPDTLDCQTRPAEYLRAIEHPLFRDQFAISRTETLAALQKPSLEGVDLIQADLSNSFLPGVAFNGADLRRADFSFAVLEGAHLENTILDDTNFSNADLRAARITTVAARNVVFSGANLADSMISSQNGFHGDFRGASMKRVRFRGTITGNFSGLPNRPIRFPNADFTNARIVNSYIGGKNGKFIFAGANLLGLQSVDGEIYLPGDTSVRLDGTALRWVDLGKAAAPNKGSALTQTEWTVWNALLRNSFGDGSVSLPSGVKRPCQWLDGSPSTPQVFFGTWRAWLEKAKQPWPPVMGLADTPHSYLDKDGKEQEFYPIKAKPLPENIPDDCEWQD